MSKLDAFLTENGISQSAFARKVGVKASTICKFVQLKRRPSLKLAGRIERETNGDVPMSYWLEVQRQDGV